MYTRQEYANMSSEADQRGEILYILIDNDTKDKSLVIAPENYYVCVPGTNETYGEINPDYERVMLLTAKELKYREIVTKAHRFLEEGFVIYNGAKYEINTQTCVDLSTAHTILKAGEMESYPWVTKDDKIVILTLKDIEYLIYLIADRRGMVWTVQYVSYKNQIDEATTKEEVRAIVVDYENADIVKQGKSIGIELPAEEEV